MCIICYILYICIKYNILYIKYIIYMLYYIYYIICYIYIYILFFNIIYRYMCVSHWYHIWSPRFGHSRRKRVSISWQEPHASRSARWSSALRPFALSLWNVQQICLWNFFMTCLWNVQRLRQQWAHHCAVISVWRLSSCSTLWRATFFCHGLYGGAIGKDFVGNAIVNV